MLERLKPILKKVAPEISLEEINEKTRLIDDLAFDSLSLMLLSLGIEEEFFDFLRSRRGKLRAVCVSGGEPTLYPGLLDFMRRIKEMGFLLKLDTNGTRPDVLKRLVCEGLLDYVAMDIKNSPEGYAKTVGIEPFDLSGVRESAEFLMSGAVDFEFRTTVVRELHGEEDIENIGKWLSGEEKFFLQTYTDSGDHIKDGYSGYTPAEMEAFTKILRKYIPKAEKRG